MPKATLSIMGLWTYDHHIFDKLTLPETLDRELVINQILMDCAELELLYPAFDTMRQAIGIWSKSRQETWQKLIDTLHFEYDPIENYNRYEDWTDTHSYKTNTKTTGSQNSTGSVDTQNQVNGFNDNLTDSDSTSSNTASDTTASGTEDHTNNGDMVHGGRIHGNIGVTTTQQMIAEERESVQFNIYDYISRDFQRRFCLGVY